MADEFMNNEPAEEIENVQDEEPKREYKALIRCIQDYCIQNHKSYRQLSLALQEDDSYISKIIRGKSNPTLYGLVKIINAIEMTPNEVLRDQITSKRLLAKIVVDSENELMSLKKLEILTEHDLKLAYKILSLFISETEDEGI